RHCSAATASTPSHTTRTKRTGYRCCCSRKHAEDPTRREPRLIDADPLLLVDRAQRRGDDFLRLQSFTKARNRGAAASNRLGEAPRKVSEKKLAGHAPGICEVEPLRQSLGNRDWLELRVRSAGAGELADDPIGAPAADRDRERTFAAEDADALI